MGIPSPDILYEDNHLIAIYKPARMPSQGDNTGDQSAVDWVMEYIRTTYNKPGNVYVGLLHRLDRPVEGVLLLAKTSKAASRMSKQFQERKIKKTYWAVVVKPPAHKTGCLQHFIEKHPTKNLVRVYDKSGKDRKQAELNYRELARQKGLACLEVHPKTGRKHQIRVQLASMGCAIVGDVKYAKDPVKRDHTVALLAKSLRFQHPVRKEEEILIEASVPRAWPWSQFKL